MKRRISIIVSLALIMSMCSMVAFAKEQTKNGITCKLQGSGNTAEAWAECTSATSTWVYLGVYDSDGNCLKYTSDKGTTSAYKYFEDDGAADPDGYKATANAYATISGTYTTGPSLTVYY